MAFTKQSTHEYVRRELTINHHKTKTRYNSKMVEKLKKPQAHEINATSFCVLPACRSNSPQLQIKFFTRELKVPLLTSPFQLLTFPVPPGKVQIDGPSHVSVNERDQDHVIVSCSSSPSNPAAKLTFVLKDENDNVIEVDPENFAERSDLVSGVESEAKYGERVKGWISTAKVTIKIALRSSPSVV